MSSETPYVGQIGDVHGDGGFAEVPELVAIVPDIAEGEVFRGASADHLQNTNLCQRFLGIGYDCGREE